MNRKATSFVTLPRRSNRQ